MQTPTPIEILELIGEGLDMAAEVNGILEIGDWWVESILNSPDAPSLTITFNNGDMGPNGDSTTYTITVDG